MAISFPLSTTSVTLQEFKYREIYYSILNLFLLYGSMIFAVLKSYFKVIALNFNLCLIINFKFTCTAVSYV